MFKKILSTLALALGLLGATSAQAAAPKHAKSVSKTLSVAKLSPDSQQIINAWMPQLEKMAHLFSDGDPKREKQAIDSFTRVMLIDIQDMGEETFQTMAEEDSLGSYLISWFKDSKMSTSFMVGVTDTESAIGWLEDSMELEDIQLKLDFGVKNPEETLRPDQVFYRANQQLQGIGYHLVGIETGGDSAVEVLLPSKKLAKFQELAQALGMFIEFNDEEIVYSDD